MKTLLSLGLGLGVLFNFAACTTVEEHPAHTTTTTTEEHRVVRPSASTTETRTTVGY